MGSTKKKTVIWDEQREKELLSGINKRKEITTAEK
jgi:hypothetical protein